MCHVLNFLLFSVELSLVFQLIMYRVLNFLIFSVGLSYVLPSYTLAQLMYFITVGPSLLFYRSCFISMIIARIIC